MLQKKYTHEEKNKYLEEFKKSGMNTHRFTKAKGIPDSTFRKWLEVDNSMSFGEVNLMKAFDDIANIDHNESKAKSIIFSSEGINIELKRIVEVILSAN